MIYDISEKHKRAKVSFCTYFKQPSSAVTSISLSEKCLLLNFHTIESSQRDGCETKKKKQKKKRRKLIHFSKSWKKLETIDIGGLICSLLDRCNG